MDVYDEEEAVIYGIWPGVAPFDPHEGRLLDCPVEDVAATRVALAQLQGSASPFYVRCYRGFGEGNTGHGVVQPATPADPSAYLGGGRLVDLVCCYSTRTADPDGFAQFVRAAVRDVHAWGGGKVQIGEEPNMPAPLDGGSPGCFEAVAAGVAAAAEERRVVGGDVQIGVNAAGFPDAEFWNMLGTHLRSSMGELDYLGLDFFPDVFRPVPHDAIDEAVGFLLSTTRERAVAAGFPDHLPFHITETGWPTSPDRDEATQARLLPLVADAVNGSGHLVEAYEFFGLRDTLSRGDWRFQFGLLRDDYTPKPAFSRVSALVSTVK